jgi:hypothetical protein
MTVEAGERWARVLDDLEADLDEVGRALDAGEAPTHRAWAPPTDLGPPPPELLARAQGLSEKVAGMLRRSEQRLGELGEELAGVDRRRRAGLAYADDQAN